MNCPNCGKEVSNEDAVFCPYCSKPLKVTKKRSGFPTAAGILTIIGCCIILFLGILFLLESQYGFMPYAFTYWSEFVGMGILSIIVFSFGLTGGILTLKRSYFVISIFGIIVVLFYSLVMILAYAINPVYEFFAVFGIPICIMSIISVIFAAISKGEFI